MSLEDEFGFVEDRSTPSRPVEAGPTPPTGVMSGMGYTPIPSPNFIGWCGNCNQLVTSLDAYCRECGRQIDWSGDYSAVPAYPADTQLRCKITGNPGGTDTWKVGHPCRCESCQRWISIQPPADTTATPNSQALESFTRNIKPKGNPNA